MMSCLQANTSKECIASRQNTHTGIYCVQANTLRGHLASRQNSHIYISPGGTAGCLQAMLDASRQCRVCRTRRRTGHSGTGVHQKKSCAQLSTEFAGTTLMGHRLAPLWRKPSRMECSNSFEVRAVFCTQCEAERVDIYTGTETVTK